jgi:hypothetical protein
MRLALKIAFALAALTCTAQGEPVLQTFVVWAANQTYQEKASLYHGWTNGFLSAAKNYANQKQQKHIVEFAGCLETMEYPQAVAVIDKYYKDHPELWQQPLAEMLTKALTAPGTACEGKSPN